METAPKKWFLAILVIATRPQEGDTLEPLVELQYKLIQAVDAEDAYRRALELGAGEALSHETDGGGRCDWDFVGLNNLKQIDAAELRDGAEVCSEMDRGEPQDYVTPKEDLSVFWSDQQVLRSRYELMGWGDPP